MGFLWWHYSYGVSFYINRYVYSMSWVIHYFSLPLLLTSLFSPWKRMIDVDNQPGFNLQRWFQTFTFNLISRAIGAVVRSVLFIVGVIFLIFVMLFGSLGLLIWCLVPFISLGVYLRFKKSPSNYLSRLLKDVKKVGFSKVLSESEFGEFFFKHTGINLGELSIDESVGMGVNSFWELCERLIAEGVFSESVLMEKGLTTSDLLFCSLWWDRQQTSEYEFPEELLLARPGLGLELLYGYTPKLNQYSVDLGLPQPFAKHLIGRGEIVNRMERTMNADNSVVLTGEPGVGKKTVVYEFALKASSGQLGHEMAYKRVLEFDYNFLLSETVDLNQKKAEFSRVLAEAAGAGNVILVMRDLHRFTNSSVEGLDFTDVLETYLEKRELKIIAITTGSDYERFLSRNLKLRKFFEIVEVKAPTREEAWEIVIEAAMRWERERKIVITVQAIKAVIEGSERYITETPFPEKALELLDAVVMKLEEAGMGEVIEKELVMSVLSEKTGVSLERLSESEKEKLSNLEEIIHERLVNQEEAVKMIAKILRGKSVGVIDSKRPLGSFLFLGPTGVGKTETAKVLARVYFGSEKTILRFDMAEYAGSEGLERLIGVSASAQPGVMTTAIRKKPASLLLLDEIEKAPGSVFNLFLSLLDEGIITDAFDRQINCQHLFVIATSNAGAEFIRQKVSEGVKGEELQKALINFVLTEKIFSPEFLNRFDGVIVYEPLQEVHLVKIAKLLLLELVSNMKLKNIMVEFEDEFARLVAQLGYDPGFGARPMRRLIELELGDLLGSALLSGEIVGGDRIKLVAGKEGQKFGWEKM